MSIFKLFEMKEVENVKLSLREVFAPLASRISSQACLTSACFTSRSLLRFPSLHFNVQQQKKGGVGGFSGWACSALLAVNVFSVSLEEHIGVMEFSFNGSLQSQLNCIFYCAGGSGFTRSESILVNNYFLGSFTPSNREVSVNSGL